MPFEYRFYMRAHDCLARALKERYPSVFDIPLPKRLSLTDIVSAVDRADSYADKTQEIYHNLVYCDRMLTVYENAELNSAWSKHLRLWRYKTDAELTDVTWVSTSDLDGLARSDAKHMNIHDMTVDVNEGFLNCILPNLHVWELKRQTVPVYHVRQYERYKREQRARQFHSTCRISHKVTKSKWDEQRKNKRNGF